MATWDWPSNNQPRNFLNYMPLTQLSWALSKRTLQAWAPHMSLLFMNFITTNIIKGKVTLAYAMRIYTEKFDKYYKGK